MQLKLKLIGIRDQDLQAAKKKCLKKIASSGVAIIKREIDKRKLVNTGALRRSVGADITGNTVKFEIDADYAGIINDGVRPHKMKYLMDAGPIPIKIKGRKIIFRIANKKNMRARGAWMHPGFKRGQGFFDVATEKIVASTAEIIAQQGLI